MNLETLTLLITQILCSVFVVVFLLKIVPARERKRDKSNVDFKIEKSQLLNKINELSDRVSYLSTELDIKNDLTEKQAAEVNSLKNQVKNNHTQVYSLKKELDEKQNYLKNCWDKIKKLEGTFGKDVGVAKPQPAPNKSNKYNICKACDRSIQYCICAG
ncbi:hypothetical protein [uncultured Psychromonas sp.]|uniref:hypothetical protein n=1 Tax=uncultured Psychromonas sp. TaxID=173974 RepID=UPI00261D7312|nr:hypothetical protein [uncultured Psychromonas sp.]